MASGRFSENNEAYNLSEVCMYIHWNTGIETNGALKTITLFDMIIFAVENNAEKSWRNRKMGWGVCSFKRGQCEREIHLPAGATLVPSTLFGSASIDWCHVVRVELKTWFTISLCAFCRTFYDRMSKQFIRRIILKVR